MAGKRTQGTGAGGRRVAGAAGAAGDGAASRAREQARVTDAIGAGAGDSAASDAAPDAGAGAKASAAAEQVQEQVIDADVIDAALDDVEKAEEALAQELAEEPDPLAQARAEADEAQDRLMRLQAEWDNFRKRTATERAQERSRAAANLVERLLPIVDDLERAIEHSDTANESSLKEGIAAVYNKLTEVLNREGVKTIDPLGEPFDANLHQAVGKADDASVPDETVTQVYQKGYEMGDRVLRTAMVVVSQGGPKAVEP